MNKIKKGDIVGRISYGKDIIFVVKKIIHLKNGRKMALLKGVTERIEATSYIEDLCLINKEIIENNIRSLEFKLETRIEAKKKNNPKYKNTIEYNKRTKRKNITGKILHLDGDSCLDNKNSHWLINV